MATNRQHAHALVDQLAPGQLAAVVHLLESLLSPEERDSLSHAERGAIAEAEEWLKHNRPIAHEEVLAEFGLTLADWDKMPAEAPGTHLKPGKKPRARRKSLMAYR